MITFLDDKRSPPKPGKSLLKQAGAVNNCGQTPEKSPVYRINLLDI